MNAVVNEVTAPPTVDEALAAVKAAVVALRTVEATHLEAEAALARGRERLTIAEAASEKIATDNADAITRHARRLEQQVKEGSTAPIPQLTVSDAHLAKELIAQRTHAAAKQMMQSLTATVEASAGQVASARTVVDTALAALRAAEVHFHIWNGLELLDQFESEFAAIYARTEARGDSTFGDAIHDNDRDHQKLRAVWNVLESRRTGPDSLHGVLTEQPPLITARAALAERDKQLLFPKEPTQ